MFLLEIVLTERQDPYSSVKNNAFLTNQEVLFKHKAHLSGNQRNTRDGIVVQEQHQRIRGLLKA